MKHLLLGTKEFLSRYYQSFKAAWSGRHVMDPPRRSEDELTFLPAHLELIEAPVSPAARWTLRTIVAFFCVALLWSIIGKLDIVAVAPGKTVVGSRTKVIQPSETAVVQRILVRDGQSVNKGDLLVELDATTTGAEHQQADESLINARMAEIRLSAISEAVDKGFLSHFASVIGVPKMRLDSEWQLASSEFAEFQARRQSLLLSIEQRQAEAQTVQSQIGPMEESVRIARERSTDLEKLLGSQYVSRHEYLAREQERVEMERSLAAQRARLREARAAISGAGEELRVLVADTRRKTLDGLRQAREQIAQFGPEVAKTRQREKLMQLRAPVDGTVQQLAIHTVGGVVTPAQELLAVVPSEEGLEVEATVLNKDIGFVRPGQRATIKVESFPYTRYGYLEGIVETVSHDAVQDKSLGMIFQARIRLAGNPLIIDGVEVVLTPGMTLSVEIKTGRRRLIDYLISPLWKHSEESMRER